jgi:hypothetical protein
MWLAGDVDQWWSACPGFDLQDLARKLKKKKKKKKRSTCSL